MEGMPVKKKQSSSHARPRNSDNYTKPNKYGEYTVNSYPVKESNLPRKSWIE